MAIMFLWKCPIERFIGIPCPGCMMTTAAYYLIQFDFEKAFYFNPAIFLLLVMSFPLLYTYQKNKKLFQALLSITLCIWAGIYLYRMLTIFPEYPMPYVHENTLAELWKWFTH